MWTSDRKMQIVLGVARRFQWPPRRNPRGGKNLAIVNFMFL
jgi:hypothetical protein